MTFSIVRPTSRHVRLAIHGCWETGTGEQLQRQLSELLATRPARVELDLRSFEEVDKAGVGILALFAQQLLAQGAGLVLEGLRVRSRNVHDLIQHLKRLAEAELLQ
jgi:anti-anti-sigma regulatory factor